MRFAGDGSTEPCRVMARRVISAMQRYVCTWVNSGSRKSTLETTRLTQLRHWVPGSVVRRVRSDAPKRYARGGGGAGVRPWRRMISAVFARSGGPPAAALITSAHSRKNYGPIAAGVTTVSPFTSSVPLLSNR